MSLFAIKERQSAFPQKVMTRIGPQLYAVADSGRAAEKEINHDDQELIL